MPAIEKPRDMAIFLLTAMLSGGGASLGLNMGADPRPDPFTGTEGKALENQIHTLENHIHDIRFELGKESRAMPAVRSLEYRLNTLQTKCDEVEKCCEKNGG